MGYKLSYGLYIGKWVYPSPETLTIYPQRGSSMCTLHTRPHYIPSTWFLNVYPPPETPHPRPQLYTLLTRPYYILTNPTPLLSILSLYQFSHYIPYTLPYTLSQFTLSQFTPTHTHTLHISNYNKNIQDIIRIFLLHLLIFSFSLLSSFLSVEHAYPLLVIHSFPFLSV